MEFNYVDWSKEQPPRIEVGDIVKVDGRKFEVVKRWREEDDITVSFTLEAVDSLTLAPYTVVP